MIIKGKIIIFIFLVIYNIALTTFGIGLYTTLSTPSTLLWKSASIMLIVVGIMGLAMLYYVQDPRNIPMSFNGKMHLILASISSILSMLIIILIGLSFKSDIILKSYSTYSFISFGIVFITGAIAGISVAKDSPFGGLFERLTIGAFMQWILVIALKLL